MKENSVFYNLASLLKQNDKANDKACIGLIAVILCQRLQPDDVIRALSL